MSTDAVRLESGSDLVDWLERLVFDALKFGAGILGAGAVVYYSIIWGVAPALTFVKPLHGFWSGPMLVAGVYFLWMAWSAIRAKDGLKIDIFDINGLGALLEKLASPAMLLLLFYLVHRYLA